MGATGRSHGRVFWGLILIAVGILLFLDQMGRVDFGYLISQYWPAIFIIIGLSILIANNFRETGGGIFFIILGGFLLLVRLRIFHHNLWHYFWPLLVIALGLWILVRPARSRDKKKMSDVSADEISLSQVFSGTSRRVDSQAFKGGTAEVVFGSAEIDMTQARLDGGQASLSLSVVLGDIELRVPDTWQIVIEGNPVLGSIEHKKKSPTDAEKTATLKINASVVLGSIRIKD